MRIDVSEEAVLLVMEIFQEDLDISVGTFKGTEALWKELEAARLVMKPGEDERAEFQMQYPFFYKLTKRGRQLVLDRSEHKAPRSTISNDLFLAFQEAKKKASYTRQMQELTGVDHDDRGKPLDPFKDLENFLKQGLKEVQELRSHPHKWDEQDLCSVCGADGRA